MPSFKAQRGQAMIFGLLFMAVVVMSMLILFNQGQLVKNRVQLENAADAAAYSQAKLAARNMNFVAYTNRAMIANEVSIGQMVSLLSWAKHYKNSTVYSNNPFYVAPLFLPSPVTLKTVLSPVTTAYTAMGTAVMTGATPMTKFWPSAISYFNSALGVFQKLFSVATLMSQFEMNNKVLEGHDSTFYTPFIGYYFMAQNALLTYQGERFSAPTLKGLLPADLDTDPDGLVSDFLGGQSDFGNLNNLYETNSPNVKTAGDSSVESYQRYAAIVNRNRDAFTADRHWNIWETVDIPIPEVTIPLASIVSITIKIDLELGFGLKNDGGSIYASKSEMNTNSDIAKLGWSAIDLASFGITIDLNIFVSVTIYLPWGDETFTVIDLPVYLPIGFPIAGATHQVVSETAHAKKTMFEWGSFGEQDGTYGGDPDDDVNEGPLDLFHAFGLAYGQIAPEFQPGGMYGARPDDVTTTYGGPPGFLSLGSNFQVSGKTYEYTVAVAKKLDDIQTTDNAGSFDIGNDANANPADWDDQVQNTWVRSTPKTGIGLTRFDVDTYSRAEATGDIAADYQQVVWGNNRPMMTISAAEAYFNNRMQGGAEAASLFSPFWDARLREPSEISLLIATGEVDWDALFAGMPSDAIGLVNWLLTSMVDTMVDESIEYLGDQLDSPYDDIFGGPLETAGEGVKDISGDVVESVTDEISSF